MNICVIRLCSLLFLYLVSDTRACARQLWLAGVDTVKVHSSRRQKSHMQRQWARLVHRGWCAGVVSTAPRSLERIRREMRQAEPPARGGAARASLG